ncbi:MAG: response regulator [Deltaproteobacteria bacterium]|nr:response regulator [Deltaproteobacteria bacterium]
MTINSGQYLQAHFREDRNLTNHTGATILIVDDEPFNIDLLEQELEALGYRTLSAANGKEALEKVKTEAPDLILLDVMMPGLDGFTICRILKEREETKLIPVVMMTALGAKEDRILGIQAGADDFLTKPVDSDELLARIQTSLKLRQEIDRRLAVRQEPKAAEALDKVFRLEGEFWTVAYRGKVAHLKDVAGLHYIAYLLRFPHKEIHVAELVTVSDGLPEGSPTMPTELSARNGLGDAGDILDAMAKRAYKQRLLELREELEEAQSRHDLGHEERVQAEIEFLMKEISRAFGLRGKPKRAHNVNEKIRVNVQRAIKSAIEKISAHHPDLGHDFTEMIRTGMYCSYAPDLRLPSPWQL